MTARFFIPVLAWLALSTSVAAVEKGIRLENFPSPYPSCVHRFTSQGEQLEMVYMDVLPAGTPRGVVLLLHGKNFLGTYFGETIGALLDTGYRVIAPDRVGFASRPSPRTINSASRGWRTIRAACSTPSKFFAPYREFLDTVSALH